MIDSRIQPWPTLKFFPLLFFFAIVDFLFLNPAIQPLVFIVKLVFRNAGSSLKGRNESWGSAKEFSSACEYPYELQQ